jgi:hypothetical protein
MALFVTAKAVTHKTSVLRGVREGSDSTQNDIKPEVKLRDLRLLREE